MVKTFPNESEFQKALIKEVLKPMAAEVFNVHGHHMQARGWADLQIYHAHDAAHVELKMEGNSLSGPQKTRMQRLLRVGFLSFTLTWKESDQTMEASDENGVVLLAGVGWPHQPLPWWIYVTSEVRQKIRSRWPLIDYKSPGEGELPR